MPISGGVPEATGWRTEVVVDGLNHPWSIAWLLDGQVRRDMQFIFQNADPKTDGQHFGSRMAWLPDKSLLIA